MFSKDEVHDITTHFCTKEELDELVALTPEGCHWTWLRRKWEVSFVLWCKTEKPEHYYPRSEHDLVGAIRDCFDRDKWRCEMRTNLCQGTLIDCAKALTAQHKAKHKPLPNIRSTYSGPT